MANPFVPPSQPNTYNLNPPSDDGSQTSSNVVAWATIKSKLADPLVSWINSTLTAATSAFSGVVQGPNSSVSGNIPVFADASGKLFSDSGVSTVGLLPSGAIVPYGGVTAPSGWLLCAGQAVSRTGANANLFAALTIQTTGNTHSTITIDGMGSTANMAAGMPISGPGIQANTTIAIVGGTSITLSQATTTSVNGIAIVVAPYGVGDGSTTFNTPDYRGRSPFGADAMGGSAANRLGSGATGGITTAAFVGASGGEQKHALIAAEGAVHNHTGTFSGSAVSLFGTTSAGINNNSLAEGDPASPTSATFTPSGSITVNNAGSGTAHNVTPPALVSLFIIKL